MLSSDGLPCLSYMSCFYSTLAIPCPITILCQQPFWVIPHACFVPCYCCCQTTVLIIRQKIPSLTVCILLHLSKYPVFGKYHTVLPGPVPITTRDLQSIDKVIIYSSFFFTSFNKDAFWGYLMFTGVQMTSMPDVPLVAPSSQLTFRPHLFQKWAFPLDHPPCRPAGIHSPHSAYPP